MLNFLKKIFNYLNPGSRLYVAFDSGGRKKPTIVLLHGIAASSKTWDSLIHEIDTDLYRVIAVDLLGFGQSPKPVDCKYTVQDHVKYINRTIQKLKIRMPFRLIGHSMGAIIAAHYTSQYPKKVKETYLLGLPLYINDSKMHTSISKVHNDLYIKVYKFLLQNKSFTINSSQNLRKLLRLEDGLSVSEDTWNSFKLSLKNTIIDQNTYNDIKHIKTPIHVIYGAMDEFLVQENIDKISVFKNVNTTKVYAADHVVNSRIAKEVIRQIVES